MAQVRNTFIKSKMNRDLDARLIPDGEYREGRNINVSKSEGAEVGALENVLGNIQITEFANVRFTGTATHLEIIGMFSDLSTSSIYVFITNYTDSSSTLLENNAIITNSSHWIFQVAIKTNGAYTIKPLVTGSFLNFSKTHPILGCDVVENLLFWTDNRNQPRKIDVTLANPSNLSTPTYYNREDTISVAKYYPYEPIGFIENTGTLVSPDYISTLKDETSEYLPPSCIAVINEISASGGLPEPTFPALLFNAATPSPRWDSAGADIMNFIGKTYGSNKKIKITNFNRPGSNPLMVTSTVSGGGGAVGVTEICTSCAGNTQGSVTGLRPDWLAGDIIGFSLGNPDWDETFPGDKDFLKEKFVRFSYRFQFDNNEFSLMAPFTQPAFLPINYGSIQVGEEERIKAETIMNSFENLVTTVGLVINLPEDFDDLRENLHVKKIQLLYKQSDSNNIEVIKDIDIDDISTYIPIPTSGLKKQLVYNYRSTEPWKTLPESEITRVNDITPIRAQAQATTGNRIVYGNFLSRNTTPDYLDYELKIDAKDGTASPSIIQAGNNLIKEYYNHTLKQGRTYQLGIVLSDKYGRQSNVILAKNDALNISSTYSASTLFAPFSNSGVYSAYKWFGNALKITWLEEIPDTLIQPGYPGLYDATNNPLGWYSYKYVVKQQEQEYYNLYLAGAMSGDVVMNGPHERSYWLKTQTQSKISLFGSNINKVPRDLNNTGPVDASFGSDVDFVARVIQNEVDSSNENNNKQTNINGEWNNVISIEPFRNLGDWTKYKGVILYDETVSPPDINGAYCYPGSDNDGSTLPGTIDPLYNADKNPYIATVRTQGVSERVGFPAILSNAGQNNLADSVFSEKLTIFETKPFKSKLDIYWETSSAGLISDLNADIKADVNITDIYNLSSFMFTQSEDFPAGTDVLAAPMIPITVGGNAVGSPSAIITLEKAWLAGIGSQADLTNNYECYQKTAGTPPTYQIRTSSVGSLGIDPFEYLNESDAETVSFNLKASFPGGNTKTFNIINAGRISNARPTWNGFVSPSPAWNNLGTHYQNWEMYTETGNSSFWKWKFFETSGQVVNKFLSSWVPVWEHLSYEVSDYLNEVNAASLTGSGYSDWIFDTFDNGTAKHSKTDVEPFIRSVEMFGNDGITSFGLVDRNYSKYGDTYIAETYPNVASDSLGAYINDLFPFMLVGIPAQGQAFGVATEVGKKILRINPDYPPSFSNTPWSVGCEGFAGTTYELIDPPAGFNNIICPMPWGGNRSEGTMYFKITLGLKETFVGGLENDKFNEHMEVWFKLDK